MRTDCGCGCGGTSTRTAAFVRPRFFAGQLLTEDDLGQLVDYMTGKSRLYNRSLSGPGVVCGLEVAGDPCGGGTVVVRPGHALDCAGNDIVLPCAEHVDVTALVRELRISSLGVDCGEPCDDDGARRYGLFVRYDEQPVEPVAPYATEEPCPSPGCVPSRIREGYRFLVKCDDFEDHRHNPGTRLLAGLGDLTKADQARARDQRLGLYVDPMFAASLGSDRAVEFTDADAQRYADSLAGLRSSGEGPPADTVARQMTEDVRALAAAIARYDTYDQAGQAELTGRYADLGTVQDARGVLATACERLTGTDTEAVWPDPLHRSIARAVVTETAARVAAGPSGQSAPLEVRMLAQGTPLSHALQVEFRADLSLIRDWLLNRLERTPGTGDVSLRAEVAAIDVPRPLPRPADDSTETVPLAELRQIAAAAAAMTTAMRRFLTDAACSTLNPPCVDCADTDVLLAHLEMDDCDVVRICSATREQVLPGGSAYGEWLPKLYRLRELAERVCCQPLPHRDPPAVPPEGAVPRPYADGLLDDWPRTDDLEQMLSLLLTPAPGETPPKAIHDQVYTAPSEVTDSLRELTVLRAQVSDLTAALEGVRAQLGGAQTQVAELQERLPDRLGQRLETLESAPATPATAATAATSSGEQTGPASETGRTEPAKPSGSARRSRSGRAQKPPAGSGDSGETT